MCGFVAAVDLNWFYGIRIVKNIWCGMPSSIIERLHAYVVNERSSQREIRKKLIKLGIFTRKTTVGKAARVDEHDLIKQFWRVAARHDRQCR